MADQPLQRPVALTMGDACGIGPEIIARLFRDPRSAGCVVLGDVEVMRRAAGFIGGMLAVARVDSPADALRAPPNCVPVLQVEGLPADLLAAAPGHVDARAGAAAAACIARAVELALAGEIAALVTAPLHKEALAAA
ncbi:MAG: 4-hydroxythreonine-4-phosphate dehydrogenase PdxA, partial [Burkholderiales bacterium]|nr:4-hydroxythreonine-4-phosphate dehydrogenase PdxA [Burkholderiales bacterium]